MPIDPDNFRQALGRWPSGVTVVTTQEGDEVHGITVSAFLSISLQPPLVAVCIDHKARAHPILQRVDRYAVSVLAESQAQVSNHFGGRPAEVEGELFEELDGMPVIRGAASQMVAQVVDRVVAGDHTIYVGRVEASRVAELAPLVYHQRRYGRVDVGGPA